MEHLGYFLGIVAGAILGYLYRDIKDALAALKRAVTGVVTRRSQPQEAKPSRVIEEITPSEQARRDQEELLNRLNKQ